MDDVNENTCLDAEPLPGNPKDALGMAKPCYWAVPLLAVYTCGQAMLDGMRKYGLFNWRQNAVRSDVYINAARRHMDAWSACQETATDSGVHHLGHAMACMAILIDAQAAGKMIDNREPDPAFLAWLKENS